MTDQENLPEIHREMRAVSGEQAAVALVTAGALVAVADRHIDPVERDTVIRYIRDRRLAPGVGEARLAGMFEQCARRLEEADFANVVIDALRPVPGRSLSSELVELAEHVAAADRGVHPYELQAVKFLRLLASLPRSKASPK